MVPSATRTMLLQLAVVFMVIYESEARVSSTKGNTMNLHVCMNTKTVAVQILTGLNHSTTCHCQAGLSIDPKLRDDYTFTPGIGWHKLHIIAQTWNEARKICRKENADLAVINSKAEEKVLVEMLKNKTSFITDAASKSLALLGIHDMFEEGEWVTISGEPLESTGYSRWSTEWYGIQPDNCKDQGCGALIIMGGMDDVKCKDKYAFFCELSATC